MRFKDFISKINNEPTVIAEHTHEDKTLSFIDWMRNKFGKNWVVAPKLTDKLKEKGYTIAFSQTKFNELKHQYDKEMNNSEYQAYVRRLSGADDKVKWWEVDESFEASQMEKFDVEKATKENQAVKKIINQWHSLGGISIKQAIKDSGLSHDEWCAGIDKLAGAPKGTTAAMYRLGQIDLD